MSRSEPPTELPVDVILEMAAKTRAAAVPAYKPDWHSPDWLLTFARYVLREIDIDPASDARAQERVRARAWCGPDHPNPERRDGLVADWRGRVYLNPPGTEARTWARRLVDVVSHPGNAVAIYVAYNIEQLRLPVAGAARAIAIPRKRVRYLDPATGKPGTAPRNASALLLLGGGVREAVAFADAARAHDCTLLEVIR